MIARDLKKVEASIAERDAPVFTHKGNFISSLSASEETECLESRRIHRQELRAEVPLVCDIPEPVHSCDEDSSRAKNVDISELISGGLGDSKLDWGDITLDNINGAISELEPTLTAQLQASSEPVRQAIDQEKLDILDAIARVKVPAMDFHIPQPESYSKDIECMMSWLENLLGLSTVQPWSNCRRQDHNLPWVIAPNMEAPREIFTKRFDLLDSMLDNPSDLLTSGAFVVKADVPSLLRVDTFDDDIEYPSMNKTKTKNAEGGMMDWNLNKIILSPALKRKTGPDNESRPRSPNLLDTDISASQLLDDLIYLRHAKRGRRGNVQSSRATDDQKVVDPTMTVPSNSEKVSQRHQKSPNLVKNTGLSDLNSLSLIELPQALAVVVSAHLPRAILESTIRILPRTARLVERDYNLHNSVVWSPGTVDRQRATSPLSAEADIIISPSTGLLVTSVMEVRQRPLPGKPGDPPRPNMLQWRLSRLCARYERLIVLISEGTTGEESRLMTEPAVQALANLSGFMSTMPCDASVAYVPRGAHNLARYICASIGVHSDAAISCWRFLVDHESQKEIFLRRLGFNPWAAQVVLGIAGMPGFVEMTPKDRICQFTAILGGDRVICRVNEALEARWN